MTEIWKDIEGYENLYQVSNLGRVKALGNGGSKNSKFSSERILKTCEIKGYLRVTLSKDGKQKQYSVHRLVAQAFLQNPDNLPQVNHKDEDKTNNRVDNLEWCSAKYNNNYGTRIQRITEKKSKQVLCVETGKIYPSLRQAERELGISHNNISAACRGIQKTCGGFHWRYTE